MDRILKIKHDNYLHDEEYDIEELIEQIKITRLADMVKSLSEKEIAAIVLVAIENYPEMVFQIMMEEYLVNKGKEKKNANSKNI
jgi:hypothetical protein